MNKPWFRKAGILIIPITYQGYLLLLFTGIAESAILYKTTSLSPTYSSIGYLAAFIVPSAVFEYVRKNKTTHQ